ncbi:MAG: polyprenyl synthetase family protein [Armatimonadota bacterium]
MSTELTQEMQAINDRVRQIIRNPSMRPHFAPAQLLEAVLAYPLAGGKTIRPAMLSFACLALGGNDEAAVRAGVAVELYHTYTLVHDDIIDRDRLRRGQPSVHALMEHIGYQKLELDDLQAAHYGLSMAILAGDCLQCWAVDLLASLAEIGMDPAVTLQLVRRLQGVTGPAIVEGEARDIHLPCKSLNELDRDAVLRITLTKTAALFAFCGWAGGMIARGKEDAAVQALSAFGERAGIAFQLRDDVLGLIADESKLGKPVGGDLREGKRTMIVMLAWERANDDEKLLIEQVLGNPQASPQEVAAVTTLFKRLGAIDDVDTMAQEYLDEGLNHLQSLPQNRYVQLLAELANRMIQREK